MDSLFTSLLGGSTESLNFNPQSPPAKEDGECASLSLDFFKMVPCDKPKKFMCEARKPVKYLQSNKYGFLVNSHLYLVCQAIFNPCQLAKVKTSLSIFFFIVI
jgi:hypothetical protein